MKKFILSFALTVLTVIALNAQTFGIKAGLNLANVTGDTYGDVDMRTSIHIGLMAEFEISESFSFQPELIYSSQGTKSEDNYPEFDEFYESTAKVDYINIPLMAKYYASENLSLEIGPQIGFLLSAEDEWKETYEGNTDSGTDDLEEYLKSIDFGLNFGLGYKLDSGLNFGARYNLGLSNLYDDEDEFYDDSIQNTVIQLSVGYFF